MLTPPWKWTCVLFCLSAHVRLFSTAWQFLVFTHNIFTSTRLQQKCFLFQTFCLFRTIQRCTWSFLLVNLKAVSHSHPSFDEADDAVVQEREDSFLHQHFSVAQLCMHLLCQSTSPRRWRHGKGNSLGVFRCQWDQWVSWCLFVFSSSNISDVLLWKHVMLTEMYSWNSNWCNHLLSCPMFVHSTSWTSCPLFQFSSETSVKKKKKKNQRCNFYWIKLILKRTLMLCYFL